MKKICNLTILLLLLFHQVNGEKVFFKNNSTEVIIIESNNFFGKSTAPHSINPYDSIEIEFANKKIMLAIGLKISTLTYRYFYLSTENKYRINYLNDSIILNYYEKKNDKLINDNNFIANSIYKRYRSINSNYTPPFLPNNISLQIRNKYFENKYSEINSFITLTQKNFNINDELINAWNALLYSNKIIELYTYQISKYKFASKINDFYKPYLDSFLLKINQFESFENAEIKKVDILILEKIYNKPIDLISITQIDKLGLNITLKEQVVSSSIYARTKNTKVALNSEDSVWISKCTNNLFKKKLILLNGLKKSIESNAPITLISVNRIHFSFDTLIKQFSDTTLYIDFWASWCTPCLKEIPFSNTLRTKYLNRKVKFIYISLDDNFEDFKRKQDEIGLKKYSNSFVVSKKDILLITEKYKLFSLPKYLIFKEGRLFNDDAPRPSDLLKLKKELLD